MASTSKAKLKAAPASSRREALQAMDETDDQSRTQADKLLSNLSTQEVDTLVHDIVLYLLIADRRKVTIKRPDIVKNVLKEHSRLFHPLMQRATEELLDVFGIRLVEIDGKQKSYLLVSKFEHGGGEEEGHCLFSDEENSNAALVVLTLAMIFMRGGELVEDELWEAFKPLGIDVDHTHIVFGDVRRLITTEFTKEGYIELTREPNAEPPRTLLSWGRRAGEETTKMDVLDFVRSFYGNCAPDTWPVQYRQAQAERGGEEGEEDMEEGDDENER